MSRRTRRNPDSNRNLYLGLGAAAVVLGAAWWWRNRKTDALAPAPGAGQDASTPAITQTGDLTPGRLTPLQTAQATLRAAELQAADTSLSADDRKAATDLAVSLRERVRTLSAS